MAGRPSNSTMPFSFRARALATTAATALRTPSSFAGLVFVAPTAANSTRCSTPPSVEYVTVTESAPASAAASPLPAAAFTSSLVATRRTRVTLASAASLAPLDTLATPSMRIAGNGPVA